MAGIEGFEPPITESKSGVLPLDDIPLNCTFNKSKQKYYIKNKKKSKLILLFFKVYII